MEQQELIAHARRIASQAELHATRGARGVLAEARDFLRIHAGEKSSFFKALQEVGAGWNSPAVAGHIMTVLNGYTRSLEAGLSGTVSFERQAQLDVVSDFLEQAQRLLETKGVHAAAPAVLIGASLEEFLRSWVEETDLSLGNRKPGLDAYATILREAGLITKQDTKDIVSWAGVRNHAAHGEWELVGDPARVRLMLEGVNLFMRKYST